MRLLTLYIKPVPYNEVNMFEYRLSVSPSDKELEIDEPLEDLFRRAAIETNSRANAVNKGRSFNVLEKIDDHHIEVRLSSNDEVIPTRALSALSRSMIALDTEGLLEGHIYRGCVLSASVIESQSEAITAISDVKLIQEIIDMLFGRTSMGNREKALAKEAVEDIRATVLKYLNDKGVSGK